MVCSDKISPQSPGFLAGYGEGSPGLGSSDASGVFLPLLPRTAASRFHPHRRVGSPVLSPAPQVLEKPISSSRKPRILSTPGTSFPKDTALPCLSFCLLGNVLCSWRPSNPRWVRGHRPLMGSSQAVSLCSLSHLAKCRAVVSSPGTGCRPPHASPAMEGSTVSCRW